MTVSRTRRRFPGVRRIAVLGLVLLAGCTSNPPATEHPATPANADAAFQLPTYAGPPDANATLIPVDVVDIVDGDTIKVRLNGNVQTVRLIGIDTPETKKQNAPVMCYGPEATAYTTELLAAAGNHVMLQKDVSETDQYGRLLRYVWLGPGPVLLDEILARDGYGQVVTFPPDVKYTDEIRRATSDARKEGRGLWGACGAFGVPQGTKVTTTATAPVTTPATAPASTRPAADDCDPSYPDVCIPPPPPDLDCSDIPYRRFVVLPPDPHHFDVEGDGLGCEGEQ